MAREDHWYVPGKHAHEKQHRHEYTTLQIMQRYALDGDHSNFYTMLLSFSRCQDKRNEVDRLCGYKSSKDAMEKSF